MVQQRLCSRQTCTREAIFTLTYAYADSTAVIGVLSTHREPHAYDLCEFHADRLTAPQGWQVVRLPMSGSDASAPVAQNDGNYPPLRSV
ncbi:DUF3499 family protein [Rothia sp. ZJ1223]|uniref:DUF3499 family protein n=1 Tax=Rothia sp. ZJ1223 TaxID=2811098 RepID=UPI00195A8B7C|nr:DUF3499 family protein [Rothia sp. ZJ1223]MBM7051428.1 DUF3499 domain-containing protein [Rothia sp. ZJ1223]